MGLFHFQQIQNTDFKALGFQQSAGVTEQFALGIQDYHTGVCLTDQRPAAALALTGATAADEYRQQIAKVLQAVEGHGKVLGQRLIGFRVWIPVFLIQLMDVAPLGGAVFFTPAVVPTRGKKHAKTQTIGTQENEYSPQTVLAKHNCNGMVHGIGKSHHNFRQTAGNGWSHEKAQPCRGDHAQQAQDPHGPSVIGLHCFCSRCAGWVRQ